MNMQDKEFDQLFRSKLEDYETEPSAGVWDNIQKSTDFHRKTPKNHWKIAASLLILLSAGVYLISRIGTAGTAPVKIVVNGNAKFIKPDATSKAVEMTMPQLKNTAKLTAKNSFKRKEKRFQPAPKAVIETQLVQQPPLTVSKPALDSFVVPDKQTPLMAKVQLVDDVPFKANSLADQHKFANTAVAAIPAKKHHIRSLGDLINVVVSKVDKRKDKIIEFSSPADEDETALSGLNLGFIRIKKQDQ
jgi:hypothetical protein